MPTTSQSIGLPTLPCRRTKSGHRIPSRSSIRITKPRIPRLDCRRTLTARTWIIQSCILTRCGSRRGSSTIPNTGSLVTQTRNGAQWPVVKDLVFRRANVSDRYLGWGMVFGDLGLRTGTSPLIRVSKAKPQTASVMTEGVMCGFWVEWEDISGTGVSHTCWPFPGSSLASMG